MRATIGDNPYHNQHIREITECIDNTVTELQFYYDGQLKQIRDALAALSEQVERLEAQVASIPSGGNHNPPTIAADIYITKQSLNNAKKDFSRIFH